MEREASEADRLFREFVQSGDPRALGEVYDRLAPELLRVALHTARDAAEAEDVLQATFVVAIERAASFDRTQRVMPWLVGILANEARKARERAARRPDPERIEHERVHDPALEAERAELLAQLDSALERVPAAFRPVLTLRLRHGLTVPEIAAALERPSGTVRSQLARGTEVLRRTLPAGLAGALLLAATPTRGLAAVRIAVVEHAALVHGPLTVVTVLGGVLAVKKWIAVAVVLVGALWFWNAVRSDSGEGELDAAAKAPSVALSDVTSPVELAPVVDEPLSSQREVAPSSDAPKANTSAATRGGTLIVHARWPDGSPAAGELVLATPPKGRSDDPLVLATDAGGTARFDELDPGSWYVRLQRGRENSAVVRAGKETELALEILDGVTVDGRVVDGRGELLAGASIWLSERYHTDLGHIVAQSDSRGEFTLRSVGPDHWLGARKRGFAPSSLRGVRRAAGDRVQLEITLEQSGSTLRGEVRGVDGNALAGALVLLGEELPHFTRIADGSSAPGAPPQRARTDAEGRFELESVALGPQPLQARAPGHAPFFTTFEVIAGDRNECTLTLQSEAKVIGRVRGPDGHPLASTWIHTEAPERFADVSTWSGLDGRFELVGLRAERLTLMAQHEQHGQAEREFELRPGTTAEWDVTLSPTPHIRGQVLGAHGAPISGMVVVALHAEDRGQRSRSNTTDTDGRFDITGLEARSYLVWVQPAHGWRAFPLLELDDVWPDGAPLVLRVPDEAEVGSITAQIVTSSGALLAGAELHVWHAERHLWRSFVSEGERGTVTVEGVPAGTVELDVRHPDHPCKRLGEHRLDAGATLDLGRIALEPSGRLRARLSGIAEELQADLSAMLVDSTNHEGGVAHIAAGELTTSPLAPGRHTLVLSGDGVRQVRREFVIEEGRETSFPLLLEHCGVRTVAFELPPGVPPPKWIACSLLHAQSGLAWGGNADCKSTPPHARISAPPGTYTLFAGGEGGLSAKLELTITDLRSDEAALVVPLLRNP